MALLLLLVLLTACDAILQDLSSKMFTFPQETNTAYVRLPTTRQDFSAVTVCLRSFTDLKRDHALFSLATSSAANDFLIYMKPENNEFHLNSKDNQAKLTGHDYKMNTWHSICATWDSVSGLGQLWLDGKPSSRKFLSSGSNINGPVIIVLGQDQDTYGGGFDIKQSFVGMMSDLHMWNYVLSPCEIQNYNDEHNFTPGNVLNWSTLNFQIAGRVLIEEKQKSCIF
ncbi:C-reactive protein-like [Seriola lalandi dorsalis]|uniref:Pentraxin family member n=1 Tax=Seriola lalandi dorsalis TaxID=1841481 RepID=A0A3B4YDS4_SERLL|nr:C-reactive protein-like [Seriola lalandi dorsalis]XP_023258849.1 C-reactive protein-like [Seriola lalandi dorsalis]